MKERESGKKPNTVGYFPVQQEVDSQTKIHHEQEKRQHYAKAGAQYRLKGRSIRLLLIAVCCLIFAVSLFGLGNYFWQARRSGNVSEELRQAYYEQATEAQPSIGTAVETPYANVDEPTTYAPLPTADPHSGRTRLAAYPENPNLNVLQRFEALQKRNRDIIGWLSIPGVLDEAVVQRDNSYYLKRDYLGYHNVTGALFLDESCKLQQVPEQLLIHGHNMKTGAMFGALKKYKVKGADFLKEHGILRFDTIYEETQYAVFAVMEIDIRPTEYDFFNFMAYPTFSSDWEFEEFIKKAQKFSMYQIHLDVRPSDRLLTLATCAGTDDNKRLLVMGRMLRPEENEIALKNALYSTKKK